MRSLEDWPWNGHNIALYTLLPIDGRKCAKTYVFMIARPQMSFWDHSPIENSQTWSQSLPKNGFQKGHPNKWETIRYTIMCYFCIFAQFCYKKIYPKMGPKKDTQTNERTNTDKAIVLRTPDELWKKPLFYSWEIGLPSAKRFRKLPRSVVLLTRRLF